MATYSSQPDESSGYDTTLESESPTTNRGTSLYLGVGERAGFTNVTRTLIRFDLSSIPSSATITSAILSLWVKTDYSLNARDFKVYRLLRDWVESEATWNNWKSGTAWTTAGAGSNGNDADLSTVWATVSFSASESAGTEKQFSLNTTEFKKLIDGTYSNYGWLIKADTEVNDAYDFYSSAETTLTTRRPKLVVEYTVPSEENTGAMFMVF